MNLPEEPELDDSTVERFLGSAFRASGPPQSGSTALPLQPEPRPAPEGLPAVLGSYRVIELIARGGTSLVYCVADPELGRELALKVLRDDLGRRPEFERRFLEEARLCSRLTHPGIVPIHELGHLADGRPYFAMELVRGQTLAHILATRAIPRRGIQDLLQIFLKICQTTAYLHEKGVLHGDLKPHNIMVGAFGEVQVMDWGFARLAPEHPGTPSAVLARGALEDGGPRDARIGGTPAYMAPEQARREPENITTRTDVFGLGAVLCEVLTGAPPYLGETRCEVLLRATRGWLEDAHARLRACGQEPVLAALAERCLSADPQHRPGDAREVAREVEAHLAAVEERSRALELETAAAHATAHQAQRNRRLSVALLGSIIVSMLVVASGYLWSESKRRARRTIAEQEITDARVEANQHFFMARQAGTGEFEQWQRALAAAKRAQALSRSPDLDPEWVARVAELVTRIQSEKNRARADHQLAGQLEELGPRRDDEREPLRLEASYVAAFQSITIDVDRQPPDIAAERIQGSRIREDLLAALGEWTHLRRSQEIPDADAWRRCLAVIRHCDPDPLRDSLRDAYEATDLQRIRILIDEFDPAERPPRSLDLSARILLWLGDRPTAIGLYRRAQLLYPGDFCIAHNLANELDESDPAQRIEIKRLLWIAVALRPSDAPALTDLGRALRLRGELANARSILERACEASPDNERAQRYLGTTLCQLGQLASGISHLRRAIELRPVWPEARCELGLALIEVGRFEEALVHLREGDSLGPLLRSGWTRPSRDWIRQAELHAACRKPLEEFARSGIEPAGAEERVQLAATALRTGRHASAARLYRSALAEAPELMDDPRRLEATRAALLTGMDGTLDGAERARWLAQAAAWLRADLANLRTAGDSAETRRRLERWNADGQIQRLRLEPPAALDANERARWAELIAEIALLLERS